MTPSRILLAFLLLALAGAGAYFVRRGADDEAAAPGAAAGAAAMAQDGSTAGVVRTDEWGAGGAAAPEREDAAAAGRPVTALFIAQVDEIDQCIDPIGTELLLETPQGVLRAMVQPGGGATFEGVLVAAAGTAFTLRTAVPDRRCFPESMRVAPADLAGSPPAFAVSVALVHDHVLSGTVADASSGGPLAGAVLTVDSFVGAEAESDARGRYRLSLPEPRGTLLIRRDGYQERLWHFPEATAEGFWLPDARDFTLLKDRLTAWLEIAAFFADGTPAAGCILEVAAGPAAAPPAEALAGISAAERAHFFERVELDLFAFGRVKGAGPGGIPQLLDARGKARLQSLLPGPVTVLVRSAAEVAFAELMLEAGASRLLELTLAPGATLELVCSTGGERVAGVQVALTPEAPFARRLGWSDADGVARLGGLPAGAGFWIAVVERPGRDAALRAVPLALVAPLFVVTPGAGATREIVVELARPVTVEVAGRVVDAENGAALEARAQVIERGEGRPAAGLKVGVDGSFRGPAPAAAEILFLADGYRGRRLAAAALAAGGGPWTVALAPLAAGGTRLAVTVKDVDGVPAPGASVRIAAAVAAGKETVARLPGDRWESTGADGRFEFSLGIDPGETLAVELDVSAGDGEAFAFERVELAAGELREHVVQLRRRVALAGTVEFAAGRTPAAQARLFWRAAGAAPQDRGDCTAVASADGGFILENVEPGAGLLLAQAPLHGAVAELVVPAAGLAGVRLELAPLCQIVVEVTDARDGRPLRNVTLDGPFGAVGAGGVLVPVGSRIAVEVVAPGYATASALLAGDPGAAPLRIALEPLY